NNPSLSNLFNIRFVWLGTGTPASQPFTVYDTNFSTLSSGQTSPVPEPATPLLLFVGFAVVAMVSISRAKTVHQNNKQIVGQPLRLAWQAERPPYNAHHHTSCTCLH